MKHSLKFWPALWLGKFLTKVLKLIRKKGTTFPGFIANRLEPEMIKFLCDGLSEGIIIVTGTNGKTTTANLIAAIFKEAGIKFAFNQAGANLVTGITGALLQQTSWTGKPKVNLALLEVDEATIPKICNLASPRIAVITNFFRDQLDRYGELDTTIRLVQESLSDNTLLVLNADDPLVAKFGINHKNIVYYGIDKIPISQIDSTETREAKFCPQCGRELNYSIFHYGQLGIYKCPECNFKRPKPDILAEEIRKKEGDQLFRVGVTSYSIALEGYYNLYNALAAIAVCSQTGITTKVIDSGLRKFVAQAGRMERFNINGSRITLILVKNPTGFNQVIRTVLDSNKNISLLIGINDLAADGRDISWLWDVDFEALGQEEIRVRKIVCTGLRAEDMALRLKYAGFPEEKLIIEHALEKSLDTLQEIREKDDAVFVLPTYTLLYPMREILETRNEKTQTLQNRIEYREEAGA